MDAQHHQHTDVHHMGELVSSGQSLRAIAAHMGLSPTTIYRHLVRSGDHYERRRRRPVLPQDRKQIVCLAQQGETSIRRIAVSVHRSWHTVRRIVEAEGLPRVAAPHRCHQCGYLVRLTPCVICQAQADAVAAERARHAEAS